MRCDFTYRTHRSGDRLALHHHSARELLRGSRMRVPMPVQRGEPRRRKRFVDGRKPIDPRISLRHGFGKVRKALRETPVGDRGCSWPRTMMNETDDRRYAVATKSGETVVRPRPGFVTELLDSLPEHGKPHSRHAERGQTIHVVRPVVVPASLELID